MDIWNVTTFPLGKIAYFQALFSIFQGVQKMPLQLLLGLWAAGPK